MIALDVKKTYGEKTVLDISFSFEKGKRYALIGANGCGKSTLMKIVCGILKPDGASKIDCDEGADICYMPQNSMGFSMSVFRNVRLAIPNERALGKKARRAKDAVAESIIDRLGLTSLRNENGAKLSGGETQRLALARTLVVPHGVLLLDEPTAAMDVEAAETAERVIDEYQKLNKCTLIFATHSFNQAKRLADEVLFLHKGKLTERGCADEIFEKPVTDELKKFVLNA